MLVPQVKEVLACDQGDDDDGDEDEKEEEK